MIEKYNGGVVAGKGAEEGPDAELKAICTGAAAKVSAYMDKFSFSQALEEIWVAIRRTNKYIDETMPWALAKDPEKKDRLDTVMHNLAEALRIVSILIYPFMHSTSEKMREQLGIADVEIRWEDTFTFDVLEGNTVKKGDAIFPRMDVEKELAALEEMQKAQMEEAAKAAAALNGEEAEEEAPEIPFKDYIEFDDFEKIDFRVGKILSAEKHPKADKLLVFQVKLGKETRQIISGVAEHFKPEECVGQKVLVVCNLKPRKLRGLESHGMIMFADNGDRMEFMTTIARDGEIVC
jgi:methionyl-tRNA synthetase